MMGELVLDACVALNILATDALNDISRALDTKFILVRQAADETSFLEDVLNGERVRTEVHLDSHLNLGTLRVADLAAEELPSFADLAAHVDDGEAATLAFAFHRSLRVATDDRKARRVANEFGVGTPTSTCDLLYDYAAARAFEEEHIGTLLSAIESRARYRPPKVHPRTPWWQHHRACFGGRKSY